MTSTFLTLDFFLSLDASAAAGAGAFLSSFFSGAPPFFGSSSIISLGTGFSFTSLLSSVFTIKSYNYAPSAWNVVPPTNNFGTFPLAAEHY